ncbi:transmembrane protease serine 2-like [Pholidichthys leucotaenia]
MTTNLYMGFSSHFVYGSEQKARLSSQSDVKPQYVHHVAPKPPPEIISTIPEKDMKARCFKFTYAAVISLLLLLLLVAILLGYYYSSSCIHGLQCGDGSCVWESQWCNGMADCPAGQDEANCVRLHGSSFLLQIYSTQSKDWRTICSHGWTDQQGMASCLNMGFSRGTYFKSGQQKSESAARFIAVRSDFNPQVSILQQLVLSDSCLNNSVVTLRCTDCGKGVNSSRASGGSPASLGSWPWQVSLQVGGSHHCGGAVISPYWILTSAHCVTRFSSPGDWSVYAGIVDPSRSLFNPAYTVSHIVAHEGYNSLTRSNDIALMRLSKALDNTASGNIGPVCLPNINLNISALQKSWATYFGFTDDASGSSHLMEAQASLIDSTECNSSSHYSGRISQDMICAKETETGTSTCHADSGGPLVSLMDGIWWLIGESIWRDHCTRENLPGVYGNVSYFLDWIYWQMKRHQDD